MIKKVALLMVLFLLSIASVSAGFTVLDNEVKIIMDQESVEDAIVRIRNDEANAVSFTFDISGLDLTDNDGDEIKLSFLNADDVGAGEERDVTVRANSESGIDFERYGGNIEVSDGTDTGNFNLEVEIVPIICDFGVRGNELLLTVNDPDVGDDITPGQKVNIDAEVRNVGNDDIDVQLTGLLFSDDRRVESASSTTENVDNGDDEDIDFDLNIPVDNEDLGENDDVFLVVKAYDDDGEDENCVQEVVRLNMDLKNDAIAILDNSRFAPSTVACGQITNAIVNVANLGKDDQDVYVEVKNSGLGVSERSNRVELEDFDSKDDNEASFSIPVRIPADVKPGRYDFSVTARGDSSDSESLSLSVASCESFEVKPTFKEGAKLTLLQETLSVIAGEERTLGIRITNNEIGPVLYNIELVNVEDFADGTSSKTVTVEGNQSMTVFLPYIIREDTEAGRYAATINLRNPLGHIASQNVFFDVIEGEFRAAGTSAERSSAMKILLNTLYIILGLIALFAVLVGIKLATRKR